MNTIIIYFLIMNSMHNHLLHHDSSPFFWQCLLCAICLWWTLYSFSSSTSSWLLLKGVSFSCHSFMVHFIPAFSVVVHLSIVCHVLREIYNLSFLWQLFLTRAFFTHSFGSEGWCSLHYFSSASFPSWFAALSPAVVLSSTPSSLNNLYPKLLDIW